jgi:DedD protein
LNQAMRQRLVGTLVLGCLALIFIPLMLDGEGIDSGPVIAPLPPMPQLPVLDIPEPQRPVILADLEAEATPELAEADENAADVDVAAASGSSIAPSVEDSPRRDSAGLPEGWSVRLGVFADRSNADALLKRLIDAEYKAYSRPVQSGANTLTGIFVGPMLTRADANTLLSELSRRFQQNGIVVRYELETPPRQ